jgi:hypothetical protein
MTTALCLWGKMCGRIPFWDDDRLIPFSAMVVNLVYFILFLWLHGAFATNFLLWLTMSPLFGERHLARSV